MVRLIYELSPVWYYRLLVSQLPDFPGVIKASIGGKNHRTSDLTS